MANPNLKNGYISIANELVEKLALINIPGNEMRLIWVLWRKTWGWKEGQRKKDWDWISYSQFTEFTGINHRSIGKALKSLVGKRLLLKTEKGYKFNQNHEDWVVGKRLPPVVKRLLPSRQKATEIGRQKATHKRNYKKTNTKETITNVMGETPDMRNLEIQELWEFGLNAGLSNTKQKLNRFALKRLLRTKSIDQLKKALQFSQQIRQEPYSPQVNNWLDLEEKYLKLRDFVVRQNNKIPKKTSVNLNEFMKKE